MKDVLRNLLDERERTCEHLEMEVVDLRKKNENSSAYVKFNNNSTILDEILKQRVKKISQRILRRLKQVPHSPKMKSKILLTYLQKTSEKMEDIKELVLLLIESSEKRNP